MKIIEICFNVVDLETYFEIMIFKKYVISYLAVLLFSLCYCLLNLVVFTKCENCVLFNWAVVQNLYIFVTLLSVSTNICILKDIFLFFVYQLLPAYLQ